MKSLRLLIYFIVLELFMTGTAAWAQTTGANGMAKISGGSFIMGDSIDGEADAPPTSVTVSTFYIDTNLVNSNLWSQVRQWGLTNGYTDTGSYAAAQGGNYPVSTVNWWDAVKWCNARSQAAGYPPVYFTDSNLTSIFKTGTPATVYVNWNISGYRLPTEAEWEMAARGGLTGMRFPNGNTISESNANYYGEVYDPTSNTGYSYDQGPNGNNSVWYTNNTLGTLHLGNANTVGYYAPNSYGLNDMMGNMFEWCWDWYGAYAAGPLTDPHGASSGTVRVTRGGGWNHPALSARCANRSDVVPSFADNEHSFRAVLPAVSLVMISVQAIPSNEGTVAGGGVFLPGTMVTNVATPNTGDQFISWTSNGVVVSTSANYVFTATASLALVANFAPITYSVGVSASPANAGTVSGAGVFLPGAMDTVTASNGVNYTFSNWTQNGSVASTSVNYTFAVNSNVTLVANFAPIYYTIALSAVPVAGGTVSGAGVFASGTTNTVRASANAGYSFADWTLNGSPVSFSNVYSFVLTENGALAANFTALNYTENVSASPASGGFVTGGGTFAYGTLVTNTAIPNGGYQFTNWTVNGTAVSSSATYIFTITNNVAPVANFFSNHVDFIYTNVNGAARLIGYAGGGGAVTVPATLGGLPLADIGEEAFWNATSVTSIVIPAGVTNIGEEAFWNCTELASIQLPNTITNIQDEAFWNCTSLTNINMQDGVTNIGVESFWNCVSLVTVTIPETCLAIGYSAFDECYSLSSVTIPNSVTSIGDGAFNECYSLTNVSIGNGVSEIGNGVFAQTSLTSVAIPDTVKSIGVAAFNGCAALTNVSIPNSVLNIGVNAFGSCPLTAIYFTGDAPTANTSAFAHDTNATVYYLAGTTGWGTTFAGLQVVQWNPQIQVIGGNFGVHAGKFGFTITGPNNIPVIVQASGDLTGNVWTNLVTCSLTNGSIYFTDPSNTNGTGRYYRISSQFP
jgi:formylglycine-generating enzyme required for sulfatase activity